MDVNAGEFSRRLTRAREWVELLGHQMGSPLAGATFEELRRAMEELRVAEEDFRQQNQALLTAHRELERERGRYQQLFHFAPDAYLLTNLRGVVREANRSAAQLFGTEPERMIGKPIARYVAKEDRDRVSAEIARWQSEPAAQTLEVRLQPRSAPAFDAMVALSVARGGPEDKAVGFRWLIRDISAHRQLTAELRGREQAARREAQASEAGARHVQKLESIGVLAGGIAHDFNNLLHVVLGNADLARLHIADDSEAREHLDEVVRATQRAAELTQQLLAYSGRGEVESLHLDLSSEVREMATLLRTAISKQATLVWDLTNDLPAVCGDPAQIRQVVMNLITNASDALGEAAGTITLRTGTERDAEAGEDGPLAVFLEVADTGCGMDSSTLQRIFDPFFSTKFTGRGLGLAAVVGIVESHHGRVRIKTAPGEGSTFKVSFPGVDESADRAPRRNSRVGWRGQGTVLVVEDEEGVREVVSRMLQRLGFQVLEAGNGIEALEVVEQHDGILTAVLLDLSMPRMGGQETLSHLRERTPDLPIVLMSGYTEQDVAAKILSSTSGAVGFLQKPFLPDDLSRMLRHVSETAAA